MTVTIEEILKWLTPIKGGTGYVKNISITGEDAPAVVEALIKHRARNPSASVSKLWVRALVDNARCLEELEELGK